MEGDFTKRVSNGYTGNFLLDFMQVGSEDFSLRRTNNPLVWPYYML